jgi:branched-chain amino acid transport system substrate-binding protein
MALLNRRQFFHTATGVLAYASTTALLEEAGLAAAQPIKVGNILDKTGALNIYCLGQIDAITLAVDEMNAGGGLLGRPVELLFYDSQSNNQFNAQYATKALLQDKVDVLHAGVTSSSREVMRPIVHRYNGLYFYNSLYEGGVCDLLFYNSGITPGQQLQVLVPAAIKRFGKKCYIIAADYNYGTITAKWVQKFLRQNGAEDVAVEFFPLDVNNFEPLIARIQQKKPDFVFSALVGAAHIAFYRQYAASGMKKNIPIASGTYGLGLENTQLSPDENEGILICASYLPTIASPENKVFLAAMEKRYPGKYSYVPEYAEFGYDGILLWAEGVRKAGAIAPQAVIKALDTGVSMHAPSGLVTIDPQTHHTVRDLHLAVGNRNHSFDVLQSFSQLQPIDTQQVCNLIKNPSTNKQFEPKV